MAIYKIAECDYCNKARRLDGLEDWWIMIRTPFTFLYQQMGVPNQAMVPVAGEKKHVCDTCATLLFSLNPLAAWNANIRNNELV